MKVCLSNDSFPPLIDGVANTVVNYATVIQKKYGSAHGTFILKNISVR